MSGSLKYADEEWFVAKPFSYKSEPEKWVKLPEINYNALVREDGDPPVITTIGVNQPLPKETFTSEFEEELAQDEELFTFKAKGPPTWDESYADNEDRIVAAVKEDYGGPVPVQINVVATVSPMGDRAWRVLLLSMFGEILEILDYPSRDKAMQQVDSWKQQYKSIDTVNMGKEPNVFIDRVRKPYVPTDTSRDGVVNNSMKLQSSGRLGTVKEEEEDLADEMWGQRLAMIPTD